jgi:hypothetical protein
MLDIWLSRPVLRCQQGGAGSATYCMSLPVNESRAPPYCRSHNAWAGVQKVDGSVVATEFDGPGVTSPGARHAAAACPIGRRHAACLVLPHTWLAEIACQQQQSNMGAPCCNVHCRL